MDSLEFAYICRYLPSPPVKTGDGMSLWSSSLSLHVSRACTQGRDRPLPAGSLQDGMKLGTSQPGGDWEAGRGWASLAMTGVEMATPRYLWGKFLPQAP